jgi:hypothetical protein
MNFSSSSRIGPGGIAKGSALDDGGLCVHKTIVKTKGLGDATPANS